jgi:hypothetical protein
VNSERHVAVFVVHLRNGNFLIIRFEMMRTGCADGFLADLCGG